MALTVGTRLGSYEILGLLGAGGMGEVYRARDLRLGREVAIKVLPLDRLGDETRRRRFIQEAQAASSLDHPHIVTIHEIESHGDIDFIVMEHVRGRSLDELIPRAGLRLAELLRIAIPIAEALAVAHGRGIVHRDLKPANVMVGSDGVVKVLDFGLAKLVHPEMADEDAAVTVANDPALSAPGTIAGTAAYMAPEQATGGRVDARADIFSFGAVLYEMATGTRAFGGKSTADTLAAILHAQPKPPSELVASLSQPLERLILRCLRKDADRRYQTIRDVSLELQDIKEDSDSGRSAATAAPTSGSQIRRRAIWLAAAALAAVGVAAFWGVSRQPSSAVRLAPALAPLTSLKGLEFHPTFSPDGNQVAFTWDGEREDNWDIYLKLVDSSEIRRLTTDPGRDDAPTWSADGREIAFLRDLQKGQAIIAVSPVTGTERKIYTVTSGRMAGLSWSHDGRWLATVGDVEGASGILLIPTGTGNAVTLLRATPPEYFSAPAFSRDGRQLAFGACTAAVRCQLKVVDIGSDPSRTTAVRAVTRELGLEIPALAWSRDDRFIIYGSDARLWRVAADGTGLPERLELAGIGAETPAVAPAGNRLAFAMEHTSVSMYPLDTAFTSPAVLASSAWDFDAQFSPDGQRLAFASTRTGEGVQIWTARSDGSSARQLVQGTGAFHGSPAWSPDGHQIAFDFRHDDGSWSVFIVDSDGGAPRQLTTDPGDENVPLWSRDGQWVYYTSDQKAGRDVWRMPARGGTPQRVTTSGTRYRTVLSPDGTELFFQPRSSASNSLLSAPAPLLAVPATGAATPRQLLACVADFASNVHGLYYVECGGTDEHVVHFIDAGTSRDQVIGRTRFLDTEVTSTLAVSPDGKVILVPRLTHTADLMLIEHFL